MSFSNMPLRRIALSDTGLKRWKPVPQMNSRGSQLIVREFFCITGVPPVS